MKALKITHLLMACSMFLCTHTQAEQSRLIKYAKATATVLALAALNAGIQILIESATVNSTNEKTDDEAAETKLLLVKENDQTIMSAWQVGNKMRVIREAKKGI